MDEKFAFCSQLAATRHRSMPFRLSKRLMILSRYPTLSTSLYHGHLLWHLRCKPAQPPYRRRMATRRFISPFPHWPPRTEANDINAFQKLFDMLLHKEQRRRMWHPAFSVSKGMLFVPQDKYSHLFALAHNEIQDSWQICPSPDLKGRGTRAGYMTSDDAMFSMFLLTSRQHSGKTF